jgi:lipopolysaccharide transport system permease protein
MVGTQAMIGNSTLVRRSTCPRIALVTATLISNVPPALIMLVISIVFSAITGHLGVRVVLLPLMLLWLLVLAWGAVLVASSISVRFRDLTAIMPLVVQAGMFVTPVGYPIDNAPPHIRILLALNPVSGVIEGFRWTLLGMSPDLKIIAISGALSLVIVVVGWIVFGRLEVRFADYV